MKQKPGGRVKEEAKLKPPSQDRFKIRPHTYANSRPGRPNEGSNQSPATDEFILQNMLVGREINLDAMTYEQILELEEKIGNVSKGLRTSQIYVLLVFINRGFQKLITVTRKVQMKCNI